ncbi:MAG: glycosyltransferase, partial [Limisphaerales bacterium]
ILRRYPHLKWFSELDRGQAHALNKGLKIATGEIIAWINSDDWYASQIFPRVSEFFTSNPEKNIVMGNCYWVDASGKTFDLKVNSERGFTELKRYWFGNNIPTQPAIFFRRKLLDEFGMLDESLHYAMDYDLWMRFAQKNRFYHLNIPAAYYRFHPDAKGGDQDWEKFKPELKMVYHRYVSKRLRCRDIFERLLKIGK